MQLSVVQLSVVEFSVVHYSIESPLPFRPVSGQMETLEFDARNVKKDKLFLNKSTYISESELKTAVEFFSIFRESDFTIKINKY